MAATEHEMTGLIREHEAIRAQMKSLADSLNSLATQSIQVKDRIRGYRWALYDLRDGIQRHIELDNRIFEALLGSTSMEDLTEEHKEIQKQIDGAVWLVDSAVADELVQEELNQCASNIREAVNGICGLIEAHTAKEDRLLRLMQKDL
jgi:predicted  nucleic acid-binding Zn-ribbon protein